MRLDILKDLWVSWNMLHLWIPINISWLQVQQHFGRIMRREDI
jgi:hypothetical protein